MLVAPFYGMDSIPRRWLRKIDRQVIERIEYQTRQLIDLFWTAESRNNL